MAKSKKKDLKIEAEIGENKLNISKDSNGLEVNYDGKNRDLNIKKTDSEKHLKYDGKKLDIEVNKNAEKTDIKIDAEKGILKFVGKIIGKLVLNRFKR